MATFIQQIPIHSQIINPKSGPILNLNSLQEETHL